MYKNFNMDLINDNNNSISFPAQKVSQSKKTEKWFKKCIDAAVSLCLKEDENSVRLSQEEKLINVNLANDLLDPRDLGKVFNPMDIQSLNDVYEDVENYAIEAPYFNVLIGENSQREFNYNVIITNPEIQNKKIQKIVEKVSSFMESKINSDNFNAEAAKNEYEDMIRGYDAREMEEIRATMLLKHIEELNSFKHEFIKTNYDLLYQSEEIFEFLKRGGHLRANRVDPRDLFVYGLGGSTNIEDASIIIQRTYMSPHSVIDSFKSELTDAEIRKIDKTHDLESGNQTMMGITEDSPFSEGVTFEVSQEDKIDQAKTYLGDAVNSSGDIRVLRVSWKTFQEVNILTIEDDEGNITQEVVDINYEPNAETGETVSKDYVPAWLEGYLVGDDIYLSMGSFFGNMYSREGFELVSHPYIGYVHSMFGDKATCPMSQIRNLKYLYNIVRKEEKMAVGRNIGNVVELDLAYIPNGKDWSVEKILTYAKLANVKIVDSFAQANPNDPSSPRAGNFNTSGRVTDWGQINHIQLYRTLLQEIKSDIGEILGITPQRLGSVSNRETAQGIERSVVQSGNTTEVLYAPHNLFIKKVYKNAMELAKVVYDNQSFFIQNNMDDFMKGYMEIKGSEIAGYDYSIFVSDSRNDSEIKSILKQQAPILMQNDKIDAEGFITLLETKSISAIKKEFRNQEIRRQRLQQEAQNRQLEIQKEQLAAQEKMTAEQRAHEIQKISMDIEGKIILKEMDINNQPEDQSEEYKKSIEERKAAILEEAQRLKEQTHQDDMDIKRSKLELERMKINKQSKNK